MSYLRKIILQNPATGPFLSLYPVVLMAGLNCTVNSKLTMDEISPTIAYAEEVFRNWLLITWKVPYLDI
jgi:hypothetical protein